MEYPFPGVNPPLYTSAQYWVTHVGLIAMTILSLAVLLHGICAEPKRWHVRAFIALILLFPFFVGSLSGVEGDFHISQVYGWAIGIISLAGLINWVRWQRLHQNKPAAGVGLFVCFVLLLVIASLVMPEVAHVREFARRAECVNRMRQAALAMHDYHESFSRLPDSTIVHDDRPPRSWRVELLPYLESEHTRRGYHDNATWDSPENLPIATTSFSAYACPNNNDVRDSKGRYYTSMSAVTGPKTCFENNKGIKLDEIGDGSSNTLLLIEACGQQIVWTEPRDIDISKDPIGINLPGNRPRSSPGWGSSYHKNGGINAVFADGSTRSLPATTDKEVLRRLATANGGEPEYGNSWDR